MSKPKIVATESPCAYIGQEVHINNDSHTYYLLAIVVRNYNLRSAPIVYDCNFGLDDVDTLQHKSLTISPSTGISVKNMHEGAVDLHGALSDYKGCYYTITGECPIDVYVDGIICTVNKVGTYKIIAVSTDYISWLKNELDNNFGIDNYEKALADNKKYEEDMVVYNDYIDKKKKYDQYIIDKNNYETYQLKKEDYDNKMIQYDNDKKEYDEYLVKKQKYDKYMSDLQIYNSVMDTYNKKLEQYNKDMEQYKKDLEEYNKTHRN